MATWLRSGRECLLDTLFPPRCAGCGEAGAWWCEACNGNVVRLRWPVCPGCQRGTPLGQFCANCRAAVSLTGILAAARFREPLTFGVKALKYRHAKVLAPILAAYQVRTLENFPRRDRVTLVPVPLHPSRERRRGHNQAALLARSIGEATDRPVCHDLQRVRSTVSQTGLDRAGRRANVSDAFAWHGPPLEGAIVMLVDDVVTTGATLDACAVVCRAAGAREVWGLVVAQR